MLFQLQNCSVDFDSDFGSIWSKVGENVKSLTLGYLQKLDFLKILNYCHNLEVVDFQMYDFLEGKRLFCFYFKIDIFVEFDIHVYVKKITNFIFHLLMNYLKNC